VTLIAPTLWSRVSWRTNNRSST